MGVAAVQVEMRLPVLTADAAGPLAALVDVESLFADGGAAGAARRERVDP
jgi:hypothetical protein